MATRAEVINWARSLANRGVGVDADGVYGMQCVDLPNMIAQKFFGRSMYGNGIDMLRAGRANGWYTTGPENPRPGAIFCMRVSYHGYGHTGLVVTAPDGSGRFQTIEQNVDGGMGGGPARYRTRTLGGGSETIIGFTYPPYSDGIDGGQGATPAPAPVSKEGETMDFIFNIKGDPGWNPGTLFYYNGAINEIQGIHNPEELKYLQSIYQETHNRPLKSYGWTNQAPVYVRIFGVLRPTTSDNNVKATLDKIIKELENAT